METTRRVAGDDVSMYEDPGAVVIRPVRITDWSQNCATRKRYKVSVPRGRVESVWLMVQEMMVMCMQIKEEQDTRTLGLVSVVCQPRSSWLSKVLILKR